MTPSGPRKARVFIDADVLFAGAAASHEHGASLVILRMAEITLIDAVTSRQAIVEAERNLDAKVPRALTAFRLLVDRCVRVAPDPAPADLVAHAGLAHPEDLPILVTALREECSWLVTFNIRHFQPGHPRVRVLRPGEFLLQVRDLLAHMTRGAEDVKGA